MVTARKATGFFIAAFVAVFTASLLVTTSSIYATDGSSTPADPSATTTQTTTSTDQTTQTDAASTNTTTTAPTTVNNIPLEITPLCSDATNGLTSWHVNNKNADAVTVSWENLSNYDTGTYSAVTGESTMLTSYDARGGNNTNRFSYEGQNPTQTNAPGANADCNNGSSTPAPTCVDGNNAQNLTITFPERGRAIIATNGGTMVCNDFDVCFSSYLMPATWDNVGNSDSAYPQTIIDYACGTVTNGTQTSPGRWEAAFPMIETGTTCDNVQVDVYYGKTPMLALSAGGHGYNNIKSEIYGKTTDCTPGMGGGNGGGTTTPPATTPKTPVVNVPGKGAGTTPLEMPTTLPATGVDASPYALLYTLAAAAATYAGVYVARRRFNS